MKIRLLLSHAGNFMLGRNNHKIIRGVFHRTALDGDTAQGEAGYFHNHYVQASFYKVIDKAGNIWQSVLAKDTEYAVAQPDENMITLNYEFAGLNGSPLTPAQMKAFIADVKSDPNTKNIKPYRLKLSEIVPRKVSGWETHADVTRAYGIVGGHTDAISEGEITSLLNALK